MLALSVILAHFLGDYVFQTSWMAREKLTNFTVALLHGWIQGMFLSIAVTLTVGNQGFWITFIITSVTMFTHAAIDHWRLAKPLIWAVNNLSPKKDRYSWEEAKANAGYAPGTPPWLSNWLMFIVDNTMHLAITFVLLLIVL